MESFDDLVSGNEGGNEDGNWIDSLLREPDPVDPGEVATKPVSEKSEPEDPPAVKKKGKRVAYSVSCTLSLSGSDYQVQLLPSSSEYDKGYRLNKVNAQKPTGYNVTQVDGDILCECSDFKYRQDSSSKGCKHIRGLIDLGMFAAPSVSYRKSSGVFDG